MPGAAADLPGSAAERCPCARLTNPVPGDDVSVLVTGGQIDTGGYPVAWRKADSPAFRPDAAMIGAVEQAVLM